jgi:hypothetical protein
MEPREITIDDRTYHLRPWSYEDGRRWLYRLVTLIANAGAAGGTDMQRVGAIVGELDEATFERLCATVEKYTDLVVEKDGRSGRVPLSKGVGEHMRGRYFDLVALLKAHLEAEYAGFFDRLGELLPGDGEKAK